MTTYLVQPTIAKYLRSQINNHKKLFSDYYGHFDLTKLRISRKMPKSEEHLKPLREQRLLKRQKTIDAVSANIFFQVIGNGVVGGARGLFLYTEHKRYLFNCGEGTQRLATEQCPTRSLGQLGNIFFTSRTWNNLGGFPGMCLSIRGAGAPDVRVHGPEGCMSLFESVKDFILLFEFDVISHKESSFQDANLRVEHVPIEYVGPDVVPLKRKYCLWDGEKSDAFSQKGQRINETKFTKLAFEAAEDKPIDQTAVAYVLTFKSKPGKLDIEKCMALGVPAGPLLGELKAGKDVILEGNITVKSEDVIGQEMPTIKALVIECPNEHYLESLSKEERLNKNLSENHELGVIFHFTPRKVVATQKYQDWMKQFEDNQELKHIFINDEGKGFSSQDLLGYTKKLKTIAPDLFPPLWDRCEPEEDFSVADSQIYPPSGLRFNIRPNKGVDLEEIKPFVEAEIEAEIGEIPNANAIIEEGVSAMIADKTAPEFPKFTFLGTGSSIPNKYRTVSFILVETCPDKYIIMDCGEGSLLQLYRHFGNEKAHEILRNLKAIYISHLHADHHLGLINLMQQRTKTFEMIGKDVEKLNVICPSRLAKFLSYYDKEFEPILSDAFQIKNEHLILSSPPGSKIKTQLLYPHIMKELLKDTGLSHLYVSRAFHAPSSFCLAFVMSENEFKVLYTGDTRPNPALVEIGRHDKCPDLVIHEATMEHNMLEDAKKKKHSTFTEAIESSKEMGARFTMLTHFSQRYSKVPCLDEILPHDNVAIAFDNLSVSPQTLHLVAKMYQPLMKVFAEDLLLIEGRKAKFMNKDAIFNALNIVVDRDGPTFYQKRQKVE